LAPVELVDNFVTLGSDSLTLKLGEANYFRKIDVPIHRLPCSKGVRSLAVEEKVHGMHIAGGATCGVESACLEEIAVCIEVMPISNEIIMRVL